jgi:CubicO group peptidase (beta-lactamase class C family)
MSATMRSFLCLVLLLLAAGCASVPGRAPVPEMASHAWARFDGSRNLESGAGGLADREAKRALGIEDPVRIASISKLVVGLGVMRLVEEGRLDLDRDVSDYLGWRLRNSAFPDVPITLRLLLSHRSSLQDEVVYAVPLGASVEAAVADEKAFDAAHAPGTYFRYSNLGFPVIATAMEKVTGERFDLLMKRLVLEPLALDACFNWPTCRPGTVARAGVLYAPDGSVVRDDLKGRQPDCPVVPAADGRCDWQAYLPGTNGALFSPQGGLRISVGDLTVLGRLLLNRGRHRGRAFLSEASIAEMTRLHWRFDGINGETEGRFYCGYGLAVQILAQCAPADDPFRDGRARIGHHGDAYGLRSGLWIDAATGSGIAYFATGLGDDPPRGRSSYRTAEEWLAQKGRR